MIGKLKEDIENGEKSLKAIEQELEERQNIDDLPEKYGKNNHPQMTYKQAVKRSEGHV